MKRVLVVAGALLFGMGSYDVSDESPERRFRTLFISDVHLGARGSQADLLLDFLRYHDADTIYLVGDIVDGWALKSSWHWPQSHNDLVQKLLRKARKGAKIIYVPGNHDEFLRNYYGTHFGGIDVVENTVHTGVDGKRYLVIHGDIFDLVVQNARWLAHLGDKAYDFAIQMNRFVNFFRRMRCVRLDRLCIRHRPFVAAPHPDLNGLPASDSLWSIHERVSSTSGQISGPDCCDQLPLYARQPTPQRAFCLAATGQEETWMKDYQEHLEKLRREAAECALIRDLATDGAKRELFERLASHLTILADHVEQKMLEQRKASG